MNRKKTTSNKINLKSSSPIFTKIKLILKRYLSETIELFQKIKYKKRTNLLSKKDIFKIWIKIRKGDIILVGNLKEEIDILIPGPLTHIAMYLGHTKLISATWPCVKIASLRSFLKKYDTFVILRLPKKIPHSHRIIKQAIKFAKLQVGKPYESFGQAKKEHFFCTELVNDAYHHAGYKTGLKSIKPFRTTTDKIEKNITHVRHWLTPIEFIKGNFQIIFISHNLFVEKKEFKLKEE